MAQSGTDQPSGPETRTAHHPFDDRNADVILHSSDGVDFYVYRTILILASPFFRSMFSLPQSEISEPCQVVPVTEDSRTIESLLRICYPIKDPVIDDARHALAVFGAANKYEMEVATIFMSKAMSTIVELEPLLIYAVACKNGYEELAGQAARQVVVRGNAYLPEVEEMSAGCYHRLLKLKQIGVGRASEIGPFCGTSHGRNTSHSSVTDSALLGRQDADVVLVASDLTRFHVYKSIISLASPRLQTLIAEAEILRHGPQGSSDHTSLTTLTLQLPVDSKTLELLLALCDPAGTPILDDTALIFRALDEACKYEMHKASWILRQQFQRLMTADTLSFYLWAASYKQEEPAIKAAKLLLSHTMEELAGLYTDDMESVSAGSYYRLLRYHEECCAKISALEDWSPSTIPYPDCSDCGWRGTWDHWSTNYLRTIPERLSRRPSPTTFDGGFGFSEIVQAAKQSCSSCAQNYPGIVSFSKNIGEKIDEHISEVKLILVQSNE
ncbi:hypothetical protein WOLCODRAFT_140320 [Wolfiporia cocos MD-104 SS10]|uniref:BTB domain-containing protein n=1 Tax=Wolfiporia cocos (strain MD-104) TaxID=742152 RepID=A0A2H3JC30_WOLCO|nr:hypothetical protein WOLCODRAFT_140320 [Wolfiporia cocos MD-104 SS10]